MRFALSSALVALGLAGPISALQPGDIPVNVAVRWLPGGDVEHFYERDAVEYYRKRALTADNELKKRQAAPPAAATAEPQSDYYPVSNDGSGLKAFQGSAAAAK